MGGIIIWCKLKKCFVLCSFIVFLKMIPTLKKYFLRVGIIFKTIKLHKTKHFRPSVYRSVTVFITILWFWLFCWFVTRFWNLIFIGVDSCQNKFSMSQQTGFHFVHVWTEPIIPFWYVKMYWGKMLISMVYTFTNEMQITFLKTVAGVILANGAICVQYNGRQYNYDTNI